MSHFPVLGRWRSHVFHVHMAPSCKCLSHCLVLGGRRRRMKEERWSRESCFSCLRGRNRISTVSNTNFSHLNAEGERLGCCRPNRDTFYHQVWEHSWCLPRKEFIIRCSPHSDSSDVSCELVSCVGDFFLGTWRAALGTSAAVAAGWLRLNPVVRLPLNRAEGQSFLFHACVMLWRLRNHRSLPYIEALCKLTASNLSGLDCTAFADTFI